MFIEPDQNIVRQRATFFSLMFVAIGGVSFITMFLQVCMDTHIHICMLTSLVCSLPSKEQFDIFGNTVL